jgi:uncharacterized membrane protein YfcA
MQGLVVFAFAGFAASFVDGALGMGFGPTGSSILLASGLVPAAVSTSINLAKVATGVAAAISHWRFKNIDRKLVLKLALPGAAGAIVGTTVLSNVNGATLRPLLAALLTLIGLRILFRFARPGAAPGPASERPSPDKMPEWDQRGTPIAALCGGVTNGMIGAWGPVVTPFLLHRGLSPRYAIGSVNTAEVFVAATSAFSLIAALGSGGFSLPVVGALLAGGVLAAPVAAWLIRFIPARPMGISVAGLLLITNARDLAAWAGIGKTDWVWAVYAGIVGLIALALYAGRVRKPAPVAAKPALAPAE